jgi:hypothetical protein
MISDTEKVSCFEITTSAGGLLVMRMYQLRFARSAGSYGGIKVVFAHCEGVGVSMHRHLMQYA